MQQVVKPPAVLNVRQRAQWVVSILTVVALVASGLAALSVVSGLGVAPAVAGGPVIPTAVSLTADKTVFAAGEKVTLTATPDQNIKGSYEAAELRSVIRDSLARTNIEGSGDG